MPTYLHRDHLDSIRLITSDAGGVDHTRTFKPFGEMRNWANPAAITETKGWIGERYDAGAGLQYLNARYYDPELGLFLQPDWFEVTEPGVGTNRYAYSGNDPVNLSDPFGNAFEPDGTDYGVMNEETGEMEYGESGYGVGGASEAKRGNPVIQGTFASGSQFAGMSSSVRTRAQANSLADSKLTRAEAAARQQESIEALGNVVATAVSFLPAGGVSIGAKAVASRIVGTKATPKLLGTQNPHVQASAVNGQTAHKALVSRVSKKGPGWESEPRLIGADGKTHIPDVRTPRGYTLELKPNTPSGRKTGRTQTRRYEKQLGTKSRVIYYDP